MTPSGCLPTLFQDISPGAHSQGLFYLKPGTPDKKVSPQGASVAKKQQVAHPEDPAGCAKHKREGHLESSIQAGLHPALPPPETPELAKYADAQDPPQTYRIS